MAQRQGKSSFDITLDRPDAIYRVGDVVTGCVTINISSGSLMHKGLHLIATGRIAIRNMDSPDEDLVEVSPSYKTVDILSYEGVLITEGELKPGKNTIKFEIPTKALEGNELYETYRGVWVSVSYFVEARLHLLGSEPFVQKTSFIIEVPTKRTDLEPKPLSFEVKRDSLPASATIGDFSISGRLDSIVCPLNRPLTGHIIVHESEDPIQSIELQLVRDESVDGVPKSERSEIQNLQAAIGDVCRGVPIPLYMDFPRKFCAPTMKTNRFKVGFEVVIAVLLESGHMLTERIPIKTFRPSGLDI
ncbi:Down Syndrome Critical Region 3 (DSCR3) [Carpediemonas membranifera]|uniref:Down Syndrome Critical Region 3 (DSCR3) n=1 Tax=Carpediemonas membranifera TaxID=201153 RepID=A0A8J6ARZ2_9EUKA|nr:Down Syndrome Critical Region 3 (DSCR3) [Carpediemonas membranifera]|eukprot:KAG9392866.1 Down Syndrome Critical Region 3 (DSCR3) [Carpediemonas membranifera]